MVIIESMSARSNRKDEISCVQLTKDTKARLDKLGTKSDTYESIILNLMEKPCATNGENQEKVSDD